MILPAAIAAEPTPAGPGSVSDPLRSFDRCLRSQVDGEIERLRPAGSADAPADEEPTGDPPIGAQDADGVGAVLRLSDCQGGTAAVPVAPPATPPVPQRLDPVASDRSAARSLSNPGFGATPAPPVAPDTHGIEIVSMTQFMHRRPSLPTAHARIWSQSRPEPVRGEAMTAEPQPDREFASLIAEATPAPAKQAGTDNASPRATDVGAQVGAALHRLLSSGDPQDGPGSAPLARPGPAPGPAPQAAPPFVSPELRVLNLVLRPQELGRVAIALTLSGTSLTVTLRTEKDATRHLIEPEVERLKDRLATAGYDLDAIALQSLPLADAAAADGSQRADDRPAPSDPQARAGTDHGNDGAATGGERQRRAQRNEVAPPHRQAGDPPEPPRRTGLYV